MLTYNLNQTPQWLKGNSISRCTELNPVYTNTDGPWNFAHINGWNQIMMDHKKAEDAIQVINSTGRQHELEGKKHVTKNRSKR